MSHTVILVLALLAASCEQRRPTQYSAVGRAFNTARALCEERGVSLSWGPAYTVDVSLMHRCYSGDTDAWEVCSAAECEALIDDSMVRPTVIYARPGVKR